MLCSNLENVRNCDIFSMLTKQVTKPSLVHLEYLSVYSELCSCSTARPAAIFPVLSCDGEVFGELAGIQIVNFPSISLFTVAFLKEGR